MRAPFVLPACGPGRLGLLLSQLEEGRRRTLRLVAELPPGRLHWSSREFPNSVAAHLAHLAAIELDWLHCDLRGEEIPAAALAELPIADVRDADGRLSRAEGAGLDELLTALAKARARLAAACLTLQEARTGELVDGLEGAATPEWILTHLALHEAEHRGVLRRMLELWRTT